MIAGILTHPIYTGDFEQKTHKHTWLCVWPVSLGCASACLFCCFVSIEVVHPLKHSAPPFSSPLFTLVYDPVLHAAPITLSCQSSMLGK